MLNKHTSHAGVTEQSLALVAQVAQNEAYHSLVVTLGMVERAHATLLQYPADLAVQTWGLLALGNIAAGAACRAQVEPSTRPGAHRPVQSRRAPSRFCEHARCVGSFAGAVAVAGVVLILFVRIVVFAPDFCAAFGTSRVFAVVGYVRVHIFFIIRIF